MASAPNGGLAFAGKGGRDTANVCEANAMATAMITGAHLMVPSRISLAQDGQVKVFPRCDSLDDYFFRREMTFQFRIWHLRLLFPADATVYLSCAQCSGRIS
jgi:hypothetical protein